MTKEVMLLDDKCTELAEKQREAENIVKHR
jgi:hypothetical protein